MPRPLAAEASALEFPGSPPKPVADDISENAGWPTSSRVVQDRGERVVQLADVFEALQVEQADFQKQLHAWITRYGDEMQTRMASAITQIPATAILHSNGHELAIGSQKGYVVDNNGCINGEELSQKVGGAELNKQGSPGKTICHEPGFDFPDEVDPRGSQRTDISSLSRGHSRTLRNVTVDKILGEEGQEAALARLRKHDSEEEARGRKIASRMVLHPVFNIVCSMMIIGNSILVGISTQHSTYHETRSDFLELIGYFCSAFFLVEMLLRMDTDGLRQYFIGEECYWNLFDFILVAMSIVDFVYTLIVTDASLSGSFVTLKAIRIVRIFRVFRFFTELSMLVMMIASSLKSLIWALTLLFIIIYVFSVLLTQNATYFIRNDTSLPPEDVTQYFGDLQTSVYTLVQSTLNGISWYEVSDVCLDIGFVTTICFFSYVCFAHLAVLNIITAVFVDHAMERAKSERELMVQKELDNKALLARELIDVFNEIDADHSGDLSWEELTTFFEDERARVHFEALGLSTDDLRRLWCLLDHDQTGNVHLHEFLDGCMRLKGVAQSIDLQVLMRRTKLIEKRLVKMFGLPNAIQGEAMEDELPSRAPSKLRAERCG